MSTTPIVSLAIKSFREASDERKKLTKVDVNININGNNNGNINISINNMKDQKGKKVTKKEELIMIITKKLRS